MPDEQRAVARIEAITGPLLFHPAETYTLEVLNPEVVNNSGQPCFYAEGRMLPEHVRRVDKLYGDQLKVNGRVCVAGYTDYWSTPKRIYCVAGAFAAQGESRTNCEHELLHLIWFLNFPAQACGDNPSWRAYDFVEHGGPCDPLRTS